MSEFGKALRKARNDASLSLRVVATKLGVSAPYLSDVERGNRNPLQPRYIKKVAKLLDVDPNHLSDLANQCPRCAEKDRYIRELEEEFGVNTPEQRHLRLNRALRKAGVRGPADWRAKCES